MEKKYYFAGKWWRRKDLSLELIHKSLINLKMTNNTNMKDIWFFKSILVIL